MKLLLIKDDAGISEDINASKFKVGPKINLRTSSWCMIQPRRSSSQICPLSCNKVMDLDIHLLDEKHQVLIWITLSQEESDVIFDNRD